MFMMRKGKRFFIFGLLCSMSVALSGYGDDVPLGEIVVTPSAVAESSANSARQVDVLSSAKGDFDGAYDIGQPLSRETSVNVSRYGGLGAAQNIRMRGSTSAQVLVMVDGRPVNNPRDGAVDLTTLPLDNVERAELVHGPISDLYGSQAMGGVLNIITKKPPEDGFKTELDSSFGTFQTYRERASQGGRIGNFAYLLNGGWERTEGFRANSRYHAGNYENKFEYKLNEQNKLSLNAGFYNGQGGSPGPISSPDIDNQQRNLTHFVDAGWEYKPDDLSTITLKGYDNYDRLEFRTNTGDSMFEVPFSDEGDTTSWRGVNLQGDRKFFDIYQLIGGFNYVDNFNNSNFSGKHKYNVLAGYLENRVDVTKSLRIGFGARIDRYSNLGTQIDPSFNFIYKFTDDLKLRGLLARSFRAPTFNDLYWPDEVWDRGNPNLKPEKGIGKEIGLDNRFCKYFSAGLTYYHNNFKNLIQWAPADATDPFSPWQPSNVGSAVINGVEGEGKIYATDYITATLGYTYLRVVDDKAHKFLIYQPKNKYDFGLQYKDFNGFTVKLRGQLYGSRFHDAANTLKMKRFFTMGLDVSKRFKHVITVFFNIDNMLNEKYQVIHDYPTPGFAFTGGVKAEF